ncbi:MAG: hypothetical protein FWE24_05190 [Defluviitaleaceae bacterium]|nr:hypothetical protein [Defluviitaleaceae bacterium]
MSNNSNMSGLWTDYIRGTQTNNIVPGRQANSDLDRDAFLRLLVTQLQHQNPLDPMDDRDFIAQMAQFSALEQMQNLNATMTQGQAFSMVGKVVIGTTFNHASGQFEQIGGEVSHVVMRNGEPRLVVGGREMAVADVEEVFDVRLNQIHASILTQQSLSLVGRWVQSVVFDSDGTPIDYVEGRVSHIKFENGSPVLVVGNRDVFPANVTGIADGNIIINRNITTEDFGVTPIVGISFVLGEPQIVISDNRTIPLNSIAHLSDALRQEGQNITHGTVSGTVSAIEINAGRVYLVVGTGTDAERVSFTDFARITTPSSDDDTP